jgi:hypothetical protein
MKHRIAKHRLTSVHKKGTLEFTGGQKSTRARKGSSGVNIGAH